MVSFSHILNDNYHSISQHMVEPGEKDVREDKSHWLVRYFMRRKHGS